MFFTTTKCMNKELVVARKMKIGLIISFISILLSILLIKDNVAVGYELNIFYSYPYMFFLLLLIPLVLSGIFFWQAVFYERYRVTSAYVISWLLVIGFVIVYIILLPYIKGYYFYPMGDVLTHVGQAIDIIKTGHINNTLIYPIEHIYIAIIKLITDISIYNVSFLLKPIFLVSYFSSIYLMSNYFFNRYPLSVLIAIVGSIEIAKFQQTPHEISALLLVMVMYIYFKGKESIGKKSTFKVLLLLYFILYPFLHPLIAIVLILSTITFDLTSTIVNSLRANKLKLTAIDVDCIKRFSLFPIIGMIILLMWFWNNYWFWNHQIGTVLRWLFSEAYSNISRLDNVVNKFTVYNINPIELFAKYYIINLVIIVFAVYYILNSWRELSKKKNMTVSERCLNLIVLSSFIILMAIMGFATVIMPTWGGPERMLFYASLISPIYFCRCLFKMKSKFQNKVSLVLILFIFMLGPFIIHQSNIQDLPNLQVTHSEMNGISWFLSSKEQNITSLYNHERPFRLSALMLGSTDSKATEIHSSESKPKTHFGFDSYSNIGHEYSEDKYLLLSKYDEALYFYLYPNSTLYNHNDFLQIEKDTTVFKIYNNNEFKVYFIKSDNASIY